MENMNYEIGDIVSSNFPMENDTDLTTLLEDKNGKVKYDFI